jgi:hypothetical protein
MGAAAAAGETPAVEAGGAPDVGGVADVGGAADVEGAGTSTSSSAGGREGAAGSAEATREYAPAASTRLAATPTRNNMTAKRD